jgi:hypothetical protein
MVSLHLDKVLVEMILHEKILLYPVIEVLNLSLLFSEGLILPLVKFEALLQLELQEGIPVLVLCVHHPVVPTFTCDDQS